MTTTAGGMSDQKASGVHLGPSHSGIATSRLRSADDGMMGSHGRLRDVGQTCAILDVVVKVQPAARRGIAQVLLFLSPPLR
jgi:hypothetical protein